MYSDRFNIMYCVNFYFYFFIDIYREILIRYLTQENNALFQLYIFQIHYVYARVHGDDNVFLSCLFFTLTKAEKNVPFIRLV